MSRAWPQDRYSNHLRELQQSQFFGENEVWNVGFYGAGAMDGLIVTSNSNSNSNISGNIITMANSYTYY